MNYEQFLEQMKDDLTARFARDLPPELADVRIGIRDVEKFQGESYRGISFRSGDSPVEANLNMTGAFQAYEAGRPYENILEMSEPVNPLRLPASPTHCWNRLYRC